MTSSFCIDESRVYATGVSNGGGLTALLACDPGLNKRFAAFAGVAAATYPDSSLTEPLFGAGCKPALNGRKLPILEFHGLNDSVVAYNGDNGADNAASIPLPTFISSWLSRDDCSSASPEVKTLESGTVTESRYSCGGKKDVVVHRTIKGFGHGWPSVSKQAAVLEQLRLTPTTWNATSVILKWFAEWTL